MPQALVRIATTALLALAAAWGNAQSGDWGDVTIISSTAGNNSNRLCMGVPDHMRPADIGCPSYAPSLSTAGHVSITGNVSANKFIGDGNGLTNLNVQGDRIISNTHAVIINENTGYISLTTSGGTWGYFSAGWSLLANLLANTVSSSLVSATSVSATYVDATRNGTVSGTFGYFRYVSGTDMYGRFTGDGSGLTGVIAGATDRIVSGTNAATRMVAISDTGYISITQAGANSGWFDPYRGLVTLGVSATGPVSGTSGYFGEGVAIGKAGRLATLDVGGTISASNAIQVGASSLACSIGIPGAIRFNSGDIQYCNGVSWVTLSGGGVADWYSISNIPAQVIAVSDSTSISMQMISASTLNAYYVSGTQGYFPAATILALSAVTIGSNSVSSSLVSATNVSASFVDTTRNGAVSGTYGYFRYISGTQVYGTFLGDGSGLTGVTAGSSDRIVSGSTAQTRMVAISDTGYISVTQGGYNTAYFHPSLGLVSVGVSSTGAISGTDGYFSGRVGVGTASTVSGGVVINSEGSQTSGVYAYGNTADYSTGFTAANLNATGLGGQPGMVSLLQLGSNGGSFSNWRNNAAVLESYNAGGLIIGAYNGGDLVFQTAIRQPRMVITNAGDIGVGTASPTATLQVSGSFIVSASGQTTTPSLYVGTSGIVGIGTTAPSATLHVSGTIKVAGTGAEACDANMRGGMRRNPSTGLMELCQ